MALHILALSKDYVPNLWNARLKASNFFDTWHIKIGLALLYIVSYCVRMCIYKIYVSNSEIVFRAYLKARKSIDFL